MALDIALSSKDSLQGALDSSKHGLTQKDKTSKIPMRNILYGTVSPVKTIGITLNSTETIVQYIWHSRCCLQFSHLKTQIEISKGNGKICLKVPVIMMHLYDMTAKDLVDSINTFDVKGSKDMVLTHWQDGDYFYLELQIYEYSLLYFV